MSLQTLQPGCYRCIYLSQMKDFTLVLKKDGKVLFSSRESGLKPLVKCISLFSGKVENATIEDKVVGIAAARLIVFSRMLSRVRAGLISEKAIGHFRSHGIKFSSRKRVEDILTSNGKGPCPMEKLSRKFADDNQFYSVLRSKFNG